MRVEKVESQGRVRETERGVIEGEGSERKRGENGGEGERRGFRQMCRPVLRPSERRHTH